MLLSLGIQSIFKNSQPSIENLTKVSPKRRKLVKLEVDFIPQNRDRWEKILNDLTTDRTMAERAISDCYSYAGLPHPHIIWTDNPSIAMKTSIDRPDLVDVGGGILRRIWDSCNQEIERQIEPEFIEVIKAYANPRAMIMDEGQHIAFDPLGDFLNDVLIAEIKKVHPQLDPALLPVAMQDYRIAYLSYFDYFQQIGFNIPQIQIPIDLAKSCGCCWAFSSIAIVTPKPSSIEFNDRGRLIALTYNGFNILS
jgi:hypothetical protein